MSDTEGHLYRFSWAKKIHEESPWANTYLRQPECLAYLENVVAAYDLAKDMQFNTTVLSADWNAADKTWTVGTSAGQRLTCRYLITALGVLAATHVPKFKGAETFKGEIYHTAAWPASYDFSNKRVGVIGNGSTGCVFVIMSLPRSLHTYDF